MDEYECLTNIPLDYCKLSIRLDDDGRVVLRRNDGPEKRGIEMINEVLDLAMTAVGAICAGYLAQMVALDIGRKALYHDLRYRQVVCEKNLKQENPSLWDRALVRIGAWAIGGAVSTLVLKKNLEDGVIDLDIDCQRQSNPKYVPEA